MMDFAKAALNQKELIIDLEMLFFILSDQNEEERAETVSPLMPLLSEDARALVIHMVSLMNDGAPVDDFDTFHLHLLERSFV